VLGAAAEPATVLDSDASLPTRVAMLEKAAIEEALAAVSGNQSKAARRLGISERALRYKLAKFRDSG
jgi:DNA-binding NtrC family response regulator